MDLAGTRVLVTGASSGIGAAVAVALGRVGATVGLVARRAALLSAVRDEVVAAGGSPATTSWVADLSDLSAARQVASEAWEAFGGLDAFVANAAMPRRCHALRLEPGDLDETMRVNFTSAAHMALLLARRMAARRRGTILFMGSIGGRLTSSGEAAYIASKFAMAGFAEALAVDLAETGVRTRLVTLGAFDTPIWEQGDGDPTFYDGPRLPPTVAADAVVHVLRGGDRFETFVPERLADIVVTKTQDPDAWIARQVAEPRRVRADTV